MKLVILLVLVALAAAQNHQGPTDHDGLLLHELLRHEVRALLATEDNMSVDVCTARCDEMFDLLVTREEDRVDNMCGQECARQIHDGGRGN